MWSPGKAHAQVLNMGYRLDADHPPDLVELFLQRKIFTQAALPVAVHATGEGVACCFFYAVVRLFRFFEIRWRLCDARCCYTLGSSIRCDTLLVCVRGQIVSLVSWSCPHVGFFLGHVVRFGKGPTIIPIILLPRKEVSPRLCEGTGNGPSGAESDVFYLLPFGVPFVKVSTHRSRILSRPSRDSGSTAIVLSSRGATPINLGAMDALATMRLFFNVDLIVTTHQLKEARKNYFIPPEYELRTPLYGERPYDTFLNGFMVVDSLAEKHPNVDEGLNMRKRYWRETFEHLAHASGSTTRVPAEKGKEPVVIEEALERGYTLHKLCEVEDRAGAEKYFANVMMRLKVTEGDDPLMPRWSVSLGQADFGSRVRCPGSICRGFYTPP
ncbi:hypothetical protein B296_00029860 [Ensete ventricosum]|uniref:Uncharacterized protein n=1 Tax=Ensete ventricosum TaxID=4639 RepID=A0A426ZC89_ENSVE|nr:hypothetical protein B296_00029860 [Ensete ventricosum]